MKTLTTFVVMAALILGLVGCGRTPIPTQYKLTISSTTGGSVIAPGEGTFAYDEGTAVNLVAAEAEEGYEFVKWTGDVGTIANANVATTAITMNGDYSITADFVRVFSLTISSTTGGAVTAPGEGRFTYDAGMVVGLVATADVGYRFLNWTGDLVAIADVNAPSTTITIGGDYSITANFEPVPHIQYSLTITSTAGGSVTTPGQGTFTYDAGAVVNMVATPAGGYQFAGWTGDVATLSCGCPSTTITMNGDYSIKANFEAIPP
jgi:uncharacterized repeat protein (TIGR02543 family)